MQSAFTCEFIHCESKGVPVDRTYTGQDEMFIKGYTCDVYLSFSDTLNPFMIAVAERSGVTICTHATDKERIKTVRFRSH